MPQKYSKNQNINLKNNYELRITNHESRITNHEFCELQTI